MLTIIINWIYILFTCFCMGFGFRLFAAKVLRYSIRRMDSVLMAGLVIAAVYAQIFSLFGGVGAAANAVMTAACIVLCVAARRQMAEYWKKALRECSLPCKILIPLLFFAWSYFTSRGYMTPDTNLYYGQSIRWIEEYGVVKGLGNLHGRFGYNSSVFALSALYSMKFLLGRSLHTVNGLIAFLLSAAVLDLGRCFKRKKMLLSDYAKAAAVYYLTTVWDEIIAPSSDYAVMCTIFFIAIKWLSQLEEEDLERRNHVAPYGLLCVMAAYALTLKVTAGLILLLILKPAYRLLSEKRWKEIGIYLLLGMAVALPWMTRTVIITGWLLYPFDAIDLFSVDWKIPAGLVRTDAYFIRTWGRGSNQLAGGDAFSVWFPNWFFNRLSAMEKLFVLGDMFACLVTVAAAAAAFFRKRRQNLDALLVLAAMSAGYLFWQFNAPLPRYGYAYVLLPGAIMLGCITENIFENPIGRLVGRWGLNRVFYVILCVYGVYKLYVGGVYVSGNYRLDNYVWQETYEEGGRESCELNGITFYYSDVGRFAGYDPFPAAPGNPETFDFTLRGERIEDGFLPKTQ